MESHLRAKILHHYHKNNCTIIFFHPDYTVGCGISPHQLALAAYLAKIASQIYRRSGISPCPEDSFIITKTLASASILFIFIIYFNLSTS